MNYFLQHSLFYSEDSNSKKQLFFAVFFTFFTVVALGIDSVFFSTYYFDGRIITNILSIVYFALLFSASETELRKLMFVMVILSYIGELLFCKVLGMYTYKNSDIPLYVPFGHAIVYASGYIFSKSHFAIQNEKHLRKLFVLFFGGLFLSIGFFLEDTFTLFFGVFYFLILKRKKWSNLYNFIALCVIFIELVGTFFKCWTWEKSIFNYFSTTNPPMGAVFFYAGGDLLLAKIVSFWKNN